MKISYRVSSKTAPTDAELDFYFYYFCNKIRVRIVFVHLKTRGSRKKRQFKVAGNDITFGKKKKKNKALAFLTNLKNLPLGFLLPWSNFIHFCSPLYSSLVFCSLGYR